jgi:hypothetical protein
MNRAKLIERNKSRLNEIIAETKRQSQLVGERLGILGRLRELDRARKQVAKRLIEIDPENESEYVQHLF